MKQKYGVQFDRMNGTKEFWGERGPHFDTQGLFPFKFTREDAETAAHNLIKHVMIWAPAYIVDMETNEVVRVIR